MPSSAEVARNLAWAAVHTSWLAWAACPVVVAVAVADCRNPASARVGSAATSYCLLRLALIQAVNYTVPTLTSLCLVMRIVVVVVNAGVNWTLCVWIHVQYCAHQSDSTVSKLNNLQTKA